LSSLQLPVYKPSKEEVADPTLYASNVRKYMVSSLLLMSDLESKLPDRQCQDGWGGGGALGIVGILPGRELAASYFIHSFIKNLAVPQWCLLRHTL